MSQEQEPKPKKIKINKKDTPVNIPVKIIPTEYLYPHFREIGEKGRLRTISQKEFTVFSAN